MHSNSVRRLSDYQTFRTTAAAVKRFTVMVAIGLSATFGATLVRGQTENIPTAEAVDSTSEVPKASSSGTPVERLNSKVRPLNVAIELSNATNINGTLVEVDVLLIKTAFGEASVPLAEIAGIRFPQGEDVSTSIVMLNGDSITGATDVKLVTVDTDWGQARINGSAIRSILLIPNLVWTSSTGISGKRWTLQDAKTTTVPPTPANQTNIQGRVSPTGSVITSGGTIVTPGNSNSVPFGTPSGSSNIVPRPGTFFPNPQ